jgi:CRISPR-associated endonuclease/helicase Cas3
MLDTAACAEAIMQREPPSTREQLAEAFGLSWEDARGWLLLLIAAHDLGKASPGFQCKWRNLSGLDAGRLPDTRVHHAYAGQPSLIQWLAAHGWQYELAESAADAVCSHHGTRCRPTILLRIEGNRRALGDSRWATVRTDLLDALQEVFHPGIPPPASSLSGAGYMLLAGLTSFSDWVGSNEHLFPFGGVMDCRTPRAWYDERRHHADASLDTIGWSARIPLCERSMTFGEVFHLNPRPLQVAISEAIADLNEPAVILVEAPMGEGKTEAALFAFQELQRRLGHRGLYVAMPTQATGNAMFRRTCEFLLKHAGERRIDVQLLHGASILNADYRTLRLTGVHDENHGGELRAEEWFTRKKRGLLTEYGVGTVDQALLPIMPVRHQFVRLWGLANRVVIFDEIHAYDAYTGTLLESLVQWLHALRSTVILLSATLPPHVRQSLAASFAASLPDQESAYPRVTVYRSGSIMQSSFEADPSRRHSIRLERITTDPTIMRDALSKEIADGGLGLALVNTVARAQELYSLFPQGELLLRDGHCIGKLLEDGTEVFLFHARYPAMQRASRESNALTVFGPKGERAGRKILIATQVAEQSLDLDFDVIATDLAPIDLILQRAGRLWRHEREARPVQEPILLVAGLAESEPPVFGRPLWWDRVYRADLLLLTWLLLRVRDHMTLPDDIDAMVQAVYEETIDIPVELAMLYDSTLSEKGKSYARRLEAYRAIIGFPEDASWNSPQHFMLQDDDQPGLHRALIAQTRLGERSITVIPFWADDDFRTDLTPDDAVAREWYSRMIRLSRRHIVDFIMASDEPTGWSDSPLLRGCRPLILDERGCWIGHDILRMDEELGIVYIKQED